MMGAEPDFPADLFAVGLVALYLLEGRKPDSRALVEHFASHGTPSAPQGVPEPLWQVLAGLLQPDPQTRFRTATGARKALTAAVEMLPEPGPDDEPVEVFDQIGPLPAGFGPDGPVKAHGAPAQPLGNVQAPQQAHQAPQQYPEQPSQPSVEQPYAQPPASMSETGSFHLAPPPQQQPAPLPGPAQPYPPNIPLPAHATAPFPAAVPDHSQAPTAAMQHDRGPIRTYTAHHPQVPHPGTEVFSPAPTPVRTRPGPPPKVAIPVLLVALVCFAVGICALTQA
jgi:hypothetical protein